VRELHGQDQRELGKGQSDHREEQRLHPQRERADAERDHRRGRNADGEAAEEVPVGRGAELSERERDRVRAQAEEHGMPERHDPGVAEHHVVARHERGEERDLEREIRELVRGDRHRDQHEDRQRAGSQIEARIVESAATLGEPSRLDGSGGPHRAAPYSPVGRKSSTITISAIVTPMAAFGTRNAM
jgi:hypothetical protein